MNDSIKFFDDGDRIFYFNEMSIKEIAKTMGCLEGTVKSRLFTAKSKLRKSIDKEDSI